MLHIEGLGVTGALIADELDRRGVDFTWSDNDSPWVAWHASTGCVYPSDHRDLEAGRGAWAELYATGRFRGLVELAPYLFAHKTPPHGASYPFTRRGALNLAEPFALTVDVEGLVLAMRTRHEERRVERSLKNGVALVAHQTAERGDGYLWGWSARVRFREPDEAPARAVYTAKRHRFDNTYAYPVPSTDEWWAGSSLVLQKTPKERPDLSELLATWQVNAHALLGISDVEVLRTVQGWRPRPRAGDSGRVIRAANRVTMTPAASSGVQLGPIVARQMIDAALA